jgi:hypothetical protein
MLVFNASASDFYDKDSEEYADFSIFLSEIATRIGEIIKWKGDKMGRSLDSGWKVVGFSKPNGQGGSKRIADSKSHAGQLAGEMLIFGCKEVDVYDQFGNLYKTFKVEED